MDFGIYGKVATKLALLTALFVHALDKKARQLTEEGSRFGFVIAPDHKAPPFTEHIS